MTVYDYHSIIEYMQTTTDKECNVKVSNFVQIVGELAQSKKYEQFKELTNVWVSANQRHRPDLESKIAEKNSLKNWAAITVYADHGRQDQDTTLLSHFIERKLGSAMKYFEAYLQEKGLTIYDFTTNMN